MYKNVSTGITAFLKLKKSPMNYIFHCKDYGISMWRIAVTPFLKVNLNKMENYYAQ